MSVDDEMNIPKQSHLIIKEDGIPRRKIKSEPIVSRQAKPPEEPRTSSEVRKRGTDYSSMYKVIGLATLIVVLLALIFFVLVPKVFGGNTSSNKGGSSIPDTKVVAEGEEDPIDISEDTTTDSVSQDIDDKSASSEVVTDSEGASEDLEDVVEPPVGDEAEADDLDDTEIASDEVNIDEGSESASEDAVARMDDFILSTSNTVLLTSADLVGLSKSELDLARNEIYARRGRIFSPSDLVNYFESRSWYSGTIPASEFTNARFSEVEIKNINVIAKYEKEKGYR